jgi:flagellar motor switch protein FliG
MAEFDANENEAATGIAPVRLDPAAAAAILLLLIDEGDASAMLKDLDQEEVRRLGKAMFAATDADELTVEAALSCFATECRKVSSLSIDAEARIRSVMHGALGNVRADNILSSIAPQSSAPSLEIIRWMEVEQIQSILAVEHPQVGALILAVLVPAVAAKAIEALDERLQIDLMLRAAQLKSVSVAAIEDLEAVLNLVTSGSDAAQRQSLGGPGDVAKIIKQMPKPLSEKAIRALKKHDKQLSVIIEEEMFVFENLMDLDKKSLGSVLRNVDAAQLALALKGVDAAMANQCLATMSKRAAETIRDEIADLQMVKRTEVEAAQREIMQVFRKMVAAGDIIVAGSGEEYV